MSIPSNITTVLKNEYAIAGTPRQFQQWQREDIDKRKHVILIRDQYFALGRAEGKVHYIGTWYEQDTGIKMAAQHLDSERS